MKKPFPPILSASQQADLDADYESQILNNLPFHKPIQDALHGYFASDEHMAAQAKYTAMNIDRSATVMDMASKMRYIPDPAEFPITLTVMLDMQPFDNAMDAFIRRLQEEQRKLQEPSTTEPNP